MIEAEAPAVLAPDTTATAAPGLAGIRARYRDGKAALLERFATARPTARAALSLVRSLAGQVDITLLALLCDQRVITQTL